MRHISSLLLLFFLSLQVLSAQGSCPAGQDQVRVVLFTDNYPEETTWQLRDFSSGQIYAQETPNMQDSTLYDISVCVPSASCMQFLIEDSFGDGICCGYGQGYYLLIVNGDTIDQGGNFGRQASHNFHCPPGSGCAQADTIGLGTYTTLYDDHWYVFRPAQPGRYELSTCQLNTCNTQIWVYDDCGSLVTETYTGTIFFDNEDGGCGQQAVVHAVFAGNRDYYIRIGDNQDNCTSNQVNWELSYAGPISGCMDISACNYSPLATVGDTCYYTGDPNCLMGPDLLMREDVLRQSIQLTSYNSTDPCFVDEECISGLGVRDLLRFTTRIDNIGDQDYYAGSPSTTPHLFNNNNCHGHWHYEGYAEYMLFDEHGNSLPSSFKNGFCVMDLTCPAGLQAQYGCSDMGISAGCADIYDRSLDCQWIDLTDIPDGRYTFITRVNWNYSPDAAGRQELRYDNNWAQVCLVISRNTGSLVVTQDPNCPQYVDCNNQPFGSALIDCNGDCDGMARIGDLNGDTLLSPADMALYEAELLADTLVALPCNDIHADGSINLFDLMLLQRCQADPSRCNFPTGINNILDTAALSILAVDYEQKYIDIGLRNPSARLMGYQFTVRGIDIDSVQNLQGAQLPVQPQWANNTKMIFAYSQLDSSTLRASSPQALCRIYYSQFSEAEMCIDSIYSLVSKEYQSLQTRIEGDCIPAQFPSSLQARASVEVQVFPNPATDFCEFRFKNRGNEELSLEIYDLQGRVLRRIEHINTQSQQVDLQELPAALYYYRIQSSQEVYTGSFIRKD